MVSITRVLDVMINYADGNAVIFIFLFSNQKSHLIFSQNQE